VQLLEPKVISFTEERYSCSPGDTFTSISKQKYGTDKYAQALLLFNRHHPLAGDELQQEVSALKAQQKVYIPPLEVLENRYPGTVKDLTPLPTVGRVPGTSTVPADRSTPAAPTASHRSYQVEGTGETMRQIATKLWGNPNLWTLIDDLNPGWRHEYPIPGGALLKVPSAPPAFAETNRRGS
jgi:hypothetical protein